MRRTAILIFVVGLCSLATLLIWRHYAADEQQTSAARRVFPKVKTDRLMWPTDHTWIWAVDMPPDGKKRQDLSVVARSIHAPLRARKFPRSALMPSRSKRARPRFPLDIWPQPRALRQWFACS